MKRIYAKARPGMLIAMALMAEIALHPHAGPGTGLLTCLVLSDIQCCFCSETKNFLFYGTSTLGLPLVMAVIAECSLNG